MRKRVWPGLLFLSLASSAVLLMGCSGGGQEQTTDDTTTSASAQEPAHEFPYGPAARPPIEPTPSIGCSATQSISWADAKQHLNNEIAIVGDIFTAELTPGLGTDLYLGDSSDPENAVLVRVPDESRTNFDLPPEQLYVGRTVCVLGVIEVINQRLVLELDSDKYITILGGSGQQ